MSYQNIREEELKNKIGQDFFSDFDTSKIVGNIDFCVCPKTQLGFQTPSGFENTLLWAEAKKGTADVLTMITQLVLTIGKARTFDKFLPPAFLGAFDSNKIGFVPYNAIMDVFSMNDFNWNVTPSNHETKEFLLIKTKIETSLHKNYYVYDFLKEEKELHFFIKNNIAKATESGKILIDKNNFVPIYLRWLDQVKPSINFDWTEGRKQNILDSDFYIADLFVDDKNTADIDDDTPLNDNLFVVFKNSHYEIAKENIKQIFDASIQIKDKSAYEQFWKKYKRPPLSEIQQHIVARKDLLIPQDIRERKGAFFTPKKWVELSQKYIANVLGDDWQDDYYVWDCAAGTGNLLAGLTNKYNIWASTLDQSDVNAMHDRIENGAILLKDHVFQFDFLNDDFSKLPQGLQNIINDDEKRKKLVVYINPPYAEATSSKTVTRTGSNKSGVSTNNKNSEIYKLKIGSASNEIFALFMIRIYEKMPYAKLGQFSKLKFIQGTNFIKFKEYFLAQYLSGFIVPADTFDNVKGNFPIGFTFWDLSKKEKITQVKTNIFNKNIEFEGDKTFYGDLPINLNRWIKSFDDKTKNGFGFMENPAPDFQNNKFLNIVNKQGTRHVNYFSLIPNNLLIGLIYFTIRQVFESSWLNDRDQFLFPNDGWQADLEFQNDCLAFALFHSQNRISNKNGTNNWIPFTEQEVNAKEKFESNFMTQFIKGKIKQEQSADLFSITPKSTLSGFETLIGLKLEFSEKATNVFNAGRELWKYYHAQQNVNVNASLYDIREHFQGRNDVGKMNNKSQDETYMKLISKLRESLKILAKKIEPKVYEYGFLKE